MSELFDRMEQLRSERHTQRMILNKNTIAMRVIVVEAKAAGHSAYRIAKLLGVTHREVYGWLKG